MYYWQRHLKVSKDFYKNLKNKKILLWGLGVSGISTLKLLKNLGANVMTLDSRVKSDLKESDLIKNPVFDLVLKSPGVSWEHSYFKFCYENNIPVSGEVELVSSVTDISIVGITGSNGKSTTVTMLSRYFELLEVPHFLGGNLGLACSEMINDKSFLDIKYGIWELSSFQLELINEFSCEVAAILNLSPTHMERYEDVSSYYEAKNQIFKNLSNEKKVSSTEIKKSKFFSLEGIKDTLVVGKHNLLNFACVYEIVQRLDLYKEDIFLELVRSFKGIEHRLEYVGEYKESKVYNDSKSTNLKATITAIESFEGKSVDLIVGGKLRESDVSEYADILKFNNIKNIYKIGHASLALSEILGTDHLYESLDVFFKSFPSVKSEVLLFSPGFPSFDEFKNFEKRGEFFKSFFQKKN